MLIAAVERMDQLIELGLQLQLSLVVFGHFPGQFSGVARGAGALSQLLSLRRIGRLRMDERAFARVTPRFLDVVAAVTHFAANRQDRGAQQD